MRDEARNVGVIALVDDKGACRFVGEKPDGRIDGRRVSGVQSVETYKLWVEHFRTLVSEDPLESLTTSTRRPGDNYFLSSRVDSLLGEDDRDAQRLANDLFEALVAPSEVSMETLKERVESTFKALALESRLVFDPSVFIEVDGEIDTLHFDYAYEADQALAYMERVNLSSGDRRTWDQVHATSWMFSRLKQDGGDRAAARRVSLVKSSGSDVKQQINQMRLLERTSHVIDFARDDADRQLTELLSA